MFIITNTTFGGEYTPSKANTLEEAKAWLLECTANNIRNYADQEIEELEKQKKEKILNELLRKYNLSVNDIEEIEDDEIYEMIDCIDDYELTNEEIIEWAKENLNVTFTETSSCIYYGSDTYNLMKIYNLDDL